MAVLRDVSSETAVLDELARLKAENELLKARMAEQAKAKLRLKVSDKGAVQVLGIGSKFGITHYAQNWLTLLDMGQEIREFIELHRDELSWKGE